MNGCWGIPAGIVEYERQCLLRRAYGYVLHKNPTARHASSDLAKSDEADGLTFVVTKLLTLHYVVRTNGIRAPRGKIDQKGARRVGT